MKIVGELKLNLNNVVYGEHSISLPCNSKLMNDGLVDVFLDSLQHSLYQHSLVGGYKGLLFKKIKKSISDESTVIIPFFTTDISMSFAAFYENAVHVRNICVMSAIRHTHADLVYKGDEDVISILHIDMYTTDDKLYLEV